MTTKTKKRKSPPGVRLPRPKVAGPDKPYRDLVWDAMAKHDFSVQSLAGASKVARPTLSRWLNGSRRIYSEDLARVFTTLDIRVSAYSGKSTR